MEKSCKTCLTNHTWSISHHITPMVINEVGDKHTHQHANKQVDSSLPKNQALIRYYN